MLGGFLDPLADKIMVTTVALALGQEGIIPAALVVSAGHRGRNVGGMAETAKNRQRERVKILIFRYFGSSI